MFRHGVCSAVGWMNFLPTILLVDEDPRVRATMAARLQRMGYRVAEADSVATAKAAVLRDPPTLILLDRGLPGDGQQMRALLESLRGDPRLGHIPVLLTSTRAAMLS